jgi:uncharacterized protein YkwD
MNSKLARLVIVVILACCTSTLNHAKASNWQEQMLNSVNAMRIQRDLTPLSLCRPLTSAAQNYAETMAKQNFLAHKGKDGSSPGDRIQKAGYKWMNTNKGSMVAENIAGGQNSVPVVVKAWRNSPGHFKNMVERRFTHVGFGLAINPNSKFKKYWVQNFGFGANC